MTRIDELTARAIDLLRDLIEIPSFSGQEQETATRIASWLEREGIEWQQHGNNIYAFNRDYREGRPLLLLNSHHDTVRPNSAYTRDPFKAASFSGWGAMMPGGRWSPSWPALRTGTRRKTCRTTWCWSPRPKRKIQGPTA